jgi:hypothetical protein
MTDLIKLFVLCIRDLVRPRAALHAEITLLRHQLNVLKRKSKRRPSLKASDRLLFARLCRLFPGLLHVMRIVKPETVVRWHRRGFRAYWRWKSRGRAGRPKVSPELRALIQEMSRANPLWGAPRIHGELLKLGFEIAQSTVSKYMVPRPDRPGQSWRTFLQNHVDSIGAIDFFIVPTVRFKLLYALAILRLDRRRLVHLAVTSHPTAEWTALQILHAFPWDEAPDLLIRDRDAIYGAVFRKRLRTMGIRDGPVAPRSPWQNGHVERLIGSIRRECLDHMIIRGEDHLRRVLKSYADYYNDVRTHTSIGKDAPNPRRVSRTGSIRFASSIRSDMILRRDIRLQASTRSLFQSRNYDVGY